MLTVDCFFVQLDAKYFRKFGKTTEGIRRYRNYDREVDVESYVEYQIAVTNALYYYVNKHMTDWWVNQIVGVEVDNRIIVKSDMYHGLDDKLEEVLDILDSLLKESDFDVLEGLTWANHLAHMNGSLLEDYAGISEWLINEIAEEGIANVFDDTPE